MIRGTDASMTIRALTLDRSGFSVLVLLLALAGASVPLTLLSGHGRLDEALIRAAAITFAALVFLRADAWVASLAGPLRPGIVLVRLGLVTLLGAFGAEGLLDVARSSAAASGSPLPAIRTALFSAGLASLAAGLFRWIRFALMLGGRVRGPDAAGEEVGAAEGLSLGRKIRKTAESVRGRFRFEAVSIVALDRDALPLAAEAAKHPPGRGAEAMLPRLADGPVAAAIRSGETFIDEMRDGAGRERARIAVGIPGRNGPVGALFAVAEPGRRLARVDVVSLHGIAERLSGPIAAAVALARQRRRASRLRLVHEVSRQLSGFLSLEKLLAAAPRTIAAALGRDHVTICLANAGRLEVAARSEEPPSADLAAAALRSAAVRRCVEGRATVTASPAATGEPLFFAGTTAAILAPLGAGAEASGALVVETANPAGFSADDVAAVETLGEFLGVSVMNARLYESERGTVARLCLVADALRKLASSVDPFEILIEAARTLEKGLGAKRVDAVLFKARGFAREASATAGHAAAPAPPDAFAERAVREGRPVFSPLSDGSPDREPRREGSALAVPLASVAGVRGFVQVIRSGPDGFSPDEVRAVEMVSDALSVAIEKARRVVQLREQADVLSRMRAAESVERSRLAAILAHIPDAVVVLAADGTVERANEAARRLLPFARQGAPLVDRMPDGTLKEAIRSVANSRRAAEAEGDIPAEDGRRVVRASVHRLQGFDGIIAVFRDVTCEKEETIARERLFGNLTHDLRSPMTAILGFARMLRAGEHCDDVDERHECLDTIIGQGERLLSLVDAQLDVLRLEGVAGGCEKVPIDLERILSEVTGSLAIHANERGVSLTRTRIEGPHEVWGDARLLYRLFANLVSNAVKFTPSGGTVTVSSRPLEDGVEVAVRDSGIGIAPADQKRLFHRFARVGAPRAQANGHGLGLSIVKEIVDQHRGRIEVESEGENRGTTFRVVLPSRPVARRESSVVAAPPPAIPGRPRRVLVLDRSGSPTEALRRALAATDASIRFVTSADRIEEEATLFRPHSILAATADDADAARDVLRAMAGSDEPGTIAAIPIEIARAG